MAHNHEDVAEQLHIFVRGDDNASYQMFWDGIRNSGGHKGTHIVIADFESGKSASYSVKVPEQLAVSVV